MQCRCVRKCILTHNPVHDLGKVCLKSFGERGTSVGAQLRPDSNQASFDLAYNPYAQWKDYYYVYARKAARREGPRTSSRDAC